MRRSREAIAQSFAVLAKVPAVMGADTEASPRAEVFRNAMASVSSRWQGLLAGGSGTRFFFDVDDGERVRRDACGMVLASRDDIPRETEAVLFDLAYGEIAEGRPRIFAATVRNADGVVVYKGSVTMNPLPIE